MKCLVDYEELKILAFAAKVLRARLKWDVKNYLAKIR